jgi:hypothetical protein
MRPTITITLTYDQAQALVDAANCLADATEGNLAALTEVWLPHRHLDPDYAEADRWAHEQGVLAQAAAALLRPELDSALARDPRSQDLLHNLKMYRKHGRLPTEAERGQLP